MNEAAGLRAGLHIRTFQLSGDLLTKIITRGSLVRCAVVNQTFLPVGSTMATSDYLTIVTIRKNASEVEAGSPNTSACCPCPHNAPCETVERLADVERLPKVTQPFARQIRLWQGSA